MPQRLYFGWIIVAVCGLGLATGIATVVSATFSIMIGPMSAEFGWEAGLPFWAPLAVTLTGAVVAPLVGSLVDRYGARRIVLVSFVLEALIFASFYWMSSSIWALYLRYVALGALCLGTTHIAFARVITLWFDRRRGLALGLTLAGVGFGGIVLPLVCQLLIDTWGWRAAWLGLAAIALLITLPVLALTLRDSPEQLGLARDGDPTAATTSTALAASATGTQPASAQPLAGVDLRDARRTRCYWMMLLTFLLIGIGLQSMMLHLVPLLRAQGVEPMIAAAAQSTLFFGLVIGRLMAGWLMDRFFAPRVALAFLIAPLIGIGALAMGATGPNAFLAAALIGLAAGAEVDVIAYLVSRYFGLRQYSRIYGTFFATYSLGAGLGPILTAEGVAATGSYDSALWTLVAMLTTAAVLLAFFKPFPQWSAAAARA